MRVSSPFVLEIAKGNYCLICFQLPESTEKHHKKKHNSYHKKAQKKTQFIPQKKHKKKHNSYHKKKAQKKPQFIPQKKAQKTQSNFPFFPGPVSAFFLCFFSAFFCFFSAFGKSLLLKHVQLASPAQLQPPPQPASPPDERPSAPQPPGSGFRLSPQALPRVSPAAPAFICIVHTHSIVLLSALRWATF